MDVNLLNFSGVQIILAIQEHDALIKEMVDSNVVHALLDLAATEQLRGVDLFTIRVVLISHVLEECSAVKLWMVKLSVDLALLVTLETDLSVLMSMRYLYHGRT